MNDMSPDRTLSPNTGVAYQLNQQMTATLEAQEWNVVFAALNEAPMPMRATRSVFDKLIAQFNQIPTRP